MNIFSQITSHNSSFLHQKKQKFLSKQFLIIFPGAAVLILVLLLVLKLFYLDSRNETKSDNSNKTTIIDREHLPADIFRSKSDGDLDSILSTFAIKKEWISTKFPGNKSDKSSKKPAEEKTEWYTKTVTVPEEVNTSELNLELTNYFRKYGYEPTATEEYKSKDISLLIFADSSSNRVLARINLQHSDKIHISTSSVVLILNNITDYNKEQVNDVLAMNLQMSYIFPRNLENIDIQNKLLQMKKDVIINVTVGDKDNPEADFKTGMNDQQIKQQVKSFNSDYPSIHNVILRNLSKYIDANFNSQIKEEFSRYKIKIYNDSHVTYLGTDKHASAIIEEIRSRAVNKPLLAIISISFDELKSFYDGMLELRKKGARLYTLSEFEAISETQRNKQIKDELKKEADKNKTDKNVKDKSKIESKKEPDIIKNKNNTQKKTDKKNGKK